VRLRCRRAAGLEQWQEDLGERADRHGVQESADADRAAQEPAEREHGQLDAGPYDPE
jgi:hypothetical protein